MEEDYEPEGDDNDSDGEDVVLFKTMKPYFKTYLTQNIKTMTEYWVSQAKYYCKYCNQWMADNKASRTTHDNGPKHKQMFQNAQKEKRDKLLHGARSESDLKQQLAEIERLAKEAVSADRQEAPGLFYMNAAIADRRPPPPPPGMFNESWTAADVPDALPEADEELEDDSGGMYEIRGQTYLVGKKHEEKIQWGVRCEIFMEKLDEWIPATIIKRNEVPVPHTSIVLVTFAVSYSDSATGAVVGEVSIKSDRLRILAQATGEVMLTEEGAAAAIQAATEAVAVAAVDTNTGIGGWQTVSVSVYDEEEEELKRVEQKAKAVIEEEETDTRKRKIEQENIDLDIGDVMSTYDPYQTNMYKGVFVGGSDMSESVHVESLSQGKVVAFKKRKPKGDVVRTSVAVSDE